MKFLKGIIFGVLGGTVLIVSSVGLLWTYENNNIQSIEAISLGRKSAIDIDNSPIDLSNDGKLVNIKGDFNVLSEQPIDNIFNISVDTIKLKRVVEMYQWKEDMDEGEYVYKKEWKRRIIDSSEFVKKEYQNPTTMPYENEIFLTAEVKIGDFVISDDQKMMLSTEGVINPFPIETIIPDGFRIDDKYITNSIDLKNPEIGDVRISFVFNKDSKGTVLAKQSGPNLIDFETKSQKPINIMRGGEYTAKEMLDYLQVKNNVITWVFRVISVAFIMAGISLILKSLTSVISYIPIIGNIVNISIGIISFLLGLTLSFIVIAVAWILYYPLISTILIVGSLITFIILKKYTKDKNKLEKEVNSKIDIQN